MNGKTKRIGKMGKSRLLAFLLVACMAVGTGFLGAGPGADEAIAMPAKHVKIYLRDADGNLLTKNDLFGENATKPNAFSMKQTCGFCHNGSDVDGDGIALGATLLSVDDIEKHSYHAQLGANQFWGWDAYDNNNTTSPAAKNKNWVQSPGHVGKW